MSHQKRAGLGRYGILPSTVVRPAAQNPDGSVICPECGSDITNTKQAHPVKNPDFSDRHLCQAFTGDLFVYGWRCRRHQYDVVSPAPCHGESADNLPDGWVGVRLVFADQVQRLVATPQRELPATAGMGGDGGWGR